MLKTNNVRTMELISIEDARLEGYTVQEFGKKFIYIPNPGLGVPVIMVTSRYWSKVNGQIISPLDWGQHEIVSEVVLQDLGLWDADVDSFSGYQIVDRGSMAFLVGRFYEAAGIRLFEPTFFDFAEVMICRERQKARLSYWYDRQFGKADGIEFLHRNIDGTVYVGIALERLSEESCEKLREVIA